MHVYLFYELIHWAHVSDAHHKVFDVILVALIVQKGTHHHWCVDGVDSGDICFNVLHKTIFVKVVSEIFHLTITVTNNDE